MTAAHARQAIREAAATLLRTTPTAWTTVFETRIPKTRPNKNFLMVFSDGDVSEKTNADTPGLYQRRCALHVVGHLRLPGNTDTETVEDQMDAMAAEIETKLTFATLQAASGMTLLHGLVLGATDMAVVVDEEDKPMHAELTLSFVADYFTTEGSPATLI